MIFIFETIFPNIHTLVQNKYLSHIQIHKARLSMQKMVLSNRINSQKILDFWQRKQISKMH